MAGGCDCRRQQRPALVSDGVASYFCRHDLVSVLPLQLKSRSEPYELVLRKGAARSPTLGLLLDPLNKVRAAGSESNADRMPD